MLESRKILLKFYITKEQLGEKLLHEEKRIEKKIKHNQKVSSCTTSMTAINVNHSIRIWHTICQNWI